MHTTIIRQCIYFVEGGWGRSCFVVVKNDKINWKSSRQIGDTHVHNIISEDCMQNRDKTTLYHAHIMFYGNAIKARAFEN